MENLKHEIKDTKGCGKRCHASRLMPPRVSGLTSHAQWPKVRLGTICSRVTSGGTPSTKRPEYYGGTIPWLRTQEVDFKPIYSTELFITEDGLNNSSAKWIPENTVIVAMYGATAGRSAITKIALTTNQACCNLIIDEAQADYRFVYYSLRFRYEELEGLAKGSAQTNLNAGIIKEFEIPLPPLPVQRRIADILSAYDDLIENNRRRIAILEETARLTYRKWFGGMMKSDGGMRRETIDEQGLGVRHETIDESHVSRLGSKVPRVSGLTSHAHPRTATLGEICQIFGGGTPKTSIPEFWDGDIPWVVPTDITRNTCLALLDTERKITALGLQKSSAKMLPANAILMTSRASVGYFGMADFPVCTNQGFISIVPNNDSWRWYLLFNLMSRVEEIRSNAKGSTFPEISRARFRSMDVAIPDDNALIEFNGAVEPLMHQVRILTKQSAALAAARDMLLPRLMKGDAA